MVLPEDRLKELGIQLSEASAPLGSYLPCVQTGNLLFLSGMLPLKNGRLTRTGRVGESVSLNEAKEAAKEVVINAINIAKAYLGRLDRIARCVKVSGYIASAPDFIQQPAVLNSASDLLFDIFGDAGRHARTAIGVSILPMNSPIEIDFIFEVASE